MCILCSWLLYLSNYGQIDGLDIQERNSSDTQVKIPDRSLIGNKTVTNEFTPITYTIMLILTYSHVILANPKWMSGESPRTDGGCNCSMSAPTTRRPVTRTRQRPSDLSLTRTTPKIPLFSTSHRLFSFSHRTCIPCVHSPSSPTIMAGYSHYNTCRYRLLLSARKLTHGTTLEAES